MSPREHGGRSVVADEGRHTDGMLSDSFDGAIRRRKASTPTRTLPPIPTRHAASTSSSGEDAHTVHASRSPKEATSEDVSHMQERGRSLVRPPPFVPQRRRGLPPTSNSNTTTGHHALPAIKRRHDVTEASQSTTEASTAAAPSTSPHVTFTPRLTRQESALQPPQRYLALELSHLLAGEPTPSPSWPIESSNADSEAYSYPFPDRSDSAMFMEDDIPIRPLAANLRDTFAFFERHVEQPTSRFSNIPDSGKKGRDDLPTLFLERLAMVIDHSTWQNLRLTSSAWRKGITLVRPPVFPAVYRLPTEMIQEIYRHLAPVDFNAARHTCRAWMMASMNNTLLQIMLQRGGWWNAAEIRITAMVQQHPNIPPASAMLWALHSQLSYECALSAHWTGNGIVEFETAREEPIRGVHGDDECKCLQVNSAPRARRQLESGAQNVVTRANTTTPYSMVSIIDFSEFGEIQPFLQPSHGRSSESGSQSASQVHFSASKCGRFLLVCDNHRVFVYELCQDAEMRFVACMSCPRKVLSVSMDTSCGRYAVAMLLQGRAGLVGHIAVHNASDPPSGFDSSEPGGSMASLRQETGYRRVFWNVCTEEDPPLSVAISPQRSFVAFGSATGIEVHWIEANQQNVSRWFPLTAPSNHLYFLPSRQKLTTPERIRLVSSAAIESMNDRGVQSTFTGPSDEHRDYNAWSSEYLFGRWISRARNGHDSYHAIPLSDGEHVLFTDPRTQSLCLGGDAPVGGATERERRIIFRGPEDVAPSVYASGSDLSTGIRIFAGYGDELWFFSVPIDVFHCSTSGLNERWTSTYRTELAGDTPSSSPQVMYADDRIAGSSTGSSSSAPRMHTPSTFPLTTHAPRLRRGVWPLTFSGQRLGIVPNLLDVAVDSRPETLTLWAFSAGGIAKAWQIRATPLQRLPHVVVNRCGNIAHTACLSPTHEHMPHYFPESGDAAISEVSGISLEATDPVGTISPLSPSLYSFDDNKSTEPFPILDQDGDVVMQEAPPTGEVEDMDGSRSDRENGASGYEPDDEDEPAVGSSFDAAAADGDDSEDDPEDEPEEDYDEDVYDAAAPYDETDRGSGISARTTTQLMLCEIHDGGGAVCRGWMVPQGESSGLVLQWQGNDFHASEERGSN